MIFLFGAVLAGTWLSPRGLRLASRLRIRGMLLTVALVFVCLLSNLADLLGLAAIVVKMLCAGGVLDCGMDRIPVAVGMVPGCAVGLILAGIGASLMLGGERVIEPSSFGAVVIMDSVTTLLTPPARKYTFGRWDRKGSGEGLPELGPPGR